MSFLRYGELGDGDIVVVDTNVLDPSNLLSTKQALILLFYLRTAGVTLGLHEVVRAEWEEHFAQMFEAKTKELRRAASWLASVGAGENEPAPEQLGASQVFATRLRDLGSSLEVLRVRPEHWRQAGEMVIQKKRPSTATSQQFKDSLIWRSLIEEGKVRQVVFVTKDKGFKNEHGGLAETLAEEATSLACDITVVESLAEVLPLIDSTVRDTSESFATISDTIKSRFQSEVDEVLADSDLVTDREVDCDVVFYVTKDPEEAIATVRAEYGLIREDDDENLLRDIGFVEAEGTLTIGSSMRIETVEFESLRTVLVGPDRDVTEWLMGSPVKTRQTSPNRAVLSC